MHVCYDPNNLTVQHIITMGFAPCHLQMGEWVQLERAVSPMKLKLARAEDGSIIAKEGDEIIKTKAIKTEKDLLPPPPPPIPFEVFLASRLADIDRTYSETVGRMMQLAPIYAVKTAAAQAFLNSGTPSLELAEEATRAGISVKKLAKKIVFKNQQMLSDVMTLDQERLKLKAIVSALTTEKDVEAHLKEVGFPG